VQKILCTISESGSTHSFILRKKRTGNQGMAAMTPEKIEEQVRSVAERIADFTGVRLVKVEYVKEHGAMVLRVTIDKEGGVGTEDCVSVSRALNKKLDEMNCIGEHYYLEVASPGIDLNQV
jgi:ribosome maturation factor RimP